MDYKRIWGTVVAGLLASCGGGEPVPVDQAASPPAAAAMRRSSVVTGDAVSDWAPRNYPHLFPGTYTIGNVYNSAENNYYNYRYYPQTGNYSAEADRTRGMYVLGAFTGGQIQFVGDTASFLCRITPSACSSTPIVSDPIVISQRTADWFPAVFGWTFQTSEAGEYVSQAATEQFVQFRAFVTPAAELQKCVAREPFTVAAELKAWQSFQLPAGSWGLGVQGPLATTFVELRKRIALPGYGSDWPLAPDGAPTVLAPGQRSGFSLSVAPEFPNKVGRRVLLENMRTGATVYVMRIAERDEFLAGRPFFHDPDVTAACRQADGTPRPVCELPGQNWYYIGFHNQTNTKQPINMVGREFLLN